jgi:hypothetical protein
MKTAYLLLGPESSGTRMLAQAFVAAGCFGDGGGLDVRIRVGTVMRSSLST